MKGIMEKLYITGTLVKHIKQSKTNNKSASGYTPNCVLLLPRTIHINNNNNNNEKCVNQNQTQDSHIKTQKKINSGGVRKAILNIRQEEDRDTIKLKPKGRRKTLTKIKPVLRTPLHMTQSVFPNSSLGCTMEYYLTQFNMFRDSDEAKTVISDYLRGGPEVQRNEPSELNSFRHIYGQLYGIHLDHVKKKVENERDKGGLGGIGKKTSLHIHQNCTCVSHDVTTE
uniref:Uncharacterized protein n=2 Tax=Cacopsylla melanoneura TaxID=428564 RepID=A0A8D9ARA9_9HEMI